MSGPSTGHHCSMDPTRSPSSAGMKSVAHGKPHGDQICFQEDNFFSRCFV